MYIMVMFVCIDVTQIVRKIFHFSVKIYFFTRMKMYVRVIFIVQFSLSSLLFHYAVVS